MRYVFKFLRQLAPAPIPQSVFIELVDIMFTTTLPVTVIGITVVSMSMLIAGRTGDAVTLGLTSAAGVVALVRVLIILAYRRQVASGPLAFEEARVWEWRYGIGSCLFEALFGLLGGWALRLEDPLAPMLVTGMLFGYGAGLVTRMAVRPVLCVTSLMLVTLPTVTGFATHLGGGGIGATTAYASQMLLLAGFALAGIKTVAQGYRTTLRQLLTQRDRAALAAQDVLTGLPNRTLLEARFDEGMTRVRQTAEIQAVHCLDLDQFKLVNDTFGHPTGDALLQAVAQRLTETLRAEDTAARLGGGEFIILQVVRAAEEAMLLAHRLIRAISAPYSLEGREIRIGVSIGIALAPRDGTDLLQLTACADAALYRAKCERRGTVMFWESVAGVVTAA